MTVFIHGFDTSQRLRPEGDGEAPSLDEYRDWAFDTRWELYSTSLIVEMCEEPGFEDTAEHTAATAQWWKIEMMDMTPGLLYDQLDSFDSGMAVLADAFGRSFDWARGKGVESVLLLNSLEVDPRLRRRGLGAILLNHVLDGSFAEVAFGVAGPYGMEEIPLDQIRSFYAAVRDGVRFLGPVTASNGWKGEAFCIALSGYEQAWHENAQ